MHPHEEIAVHFVGHSHDPNHLSSIRETLVKPSSRTIITRNLTAAEKSLFKKILIANRGEIACRIIASARRLNISTVAVYSEADRDAIHVELADEAVCIGPAPVVQSYLDQRAIIAACKSTGAQAVHPGYGFLSENASFAQALSVQDIVFIGPGPRAIEAMGDKITAKRLAQEAGVNVIPGHDGVISDASEAVRIAYAIGYPVMLKASAGGGGKGMRIAHDDAQCHEGFQRAASEAKTSFGDDRIFIEKYIDKPRHIEIQVLADTHGNIIHLGERECSVQRRHQKVIEESPSTCLDDKTRCEMGAQAIALARAVDYCSAGTVEFIVDQTRGFYFLEMNTRLQVEHPVTEFVTGLDLVEQMLRIAHGEPLQLTQCDVVMAGWAMEARIYAEDPFRSFLPSLGRLTRFSLPEESDRVRVDSGVREGGEVSIHYDPMMAKLVAYGDDRDECIGELARALDAFFVRGVAHNIRFLRTLLRNERFVGGDLNTNLIDEIYPDGFTPADTLHSLCALVALGGFMHLRIAQRDMALSGRLPGCTAEATLHWVALVEDKEYSLELTSTEGGFDVSVGGQLYQLRSDWFPGQVLFRGTLNGDPVCVQFEREGVAYRLTHAGAEIVIQFLTPRAAALSQFMLPTETPDLSRYLLSPMPGLLISVAVEPGAQVKPGDELAIVEAMKMENTLRAGRNGVVAAIITSPGESLSVDQAIIEFE